MAQGRVRVNGRVVTEPGTRVDPASDRVEVDGRVVRASPVRWILMHKPGGTLTTRSDPHGGATVYGLLPPELAELRYVGRLDRDTEGLLLFTNDGDLAHRLLHPSSEVEREYHVGVLGQPDSRALALLLQGVELEDGRARARAAKIVGRWSDGTVLSLVLLEGRKREVRRLMEAVGHPARWLTRVRFGPQELGGLERGGWRELRPGEVARLRAAATPGGGRGRTGKGKAGKGTAGKRTAVRGTSGKGTAPKGTPEKKGTGGTRRPRR
jgi:23S rRNA pseudouridine2605 synthase